MSLKRTLSIAGCILFVSLHLHAQSAANPPLPEIHQLMREVQEHQKQLEKVRENYTYNSFQTTQEIDGKGQVKKTETHEYEVFYVKNRPINRLVKKDGKPLDEHEQQKETERITKAVEKAADPPKDEESLSLRKILESVEVRNPRRENFRGRPTIVFDFIGSKALKAHGMAEDASKKLQGTVWIDEADRMVAHLDVSLNDNFHVGGGLVANIEKGSNFHFDQAPVNGEVWLPTGAEANMSARILLLKGIREHFTERDSNYQRFRVETACTGPNCPRPPA